MCKWCKLKLAPTGFNRLSLDSDVSSGGGAGDDRDDVKVAIGDVDAVSVGVDGDGNNCGDMVEPDVSTAEVTKRPKATMLGSSRLERLLAVDGNSHCVDCQSAGPEWASLSYGTVLCLQCSGQHRGYGVHISFVRSLKLDKWDEDQVKTMMLGGNRKFWNFVAPLKIVSSADSEQLKEDTGNKKESSRQADGDGTESAAAAAEADGAIGDENKWAELISRGGLSYQSRRAAYYREMMSSIVKGLVPPPDIPERYDVTAATAAAIASVAEDSETEVGSETAALGADGKPPTSFVAALCEGDDIKVSNLVVATGVKASRRPEWASDKAVKECMHCQAPFSLFRRRHHCRKCGDCVCSACAPGDNTRPMPELGYTGEVRLCLKCFCPPSRRAMMAMDSGRSNA